MATKSKDYNGEGVRRVTPPGKINDYERTTPGRFRGETPNFNNTTTSRTIPGFSKGEMPSRSRTTPTPVRSPRPINLGRRLNPINLREVDLRKAKKKSAFLKVVRKRLNKGK